jgi:hypothetical protein
MEREKKYARGLDNSRQHRRKMHFSGPESSHSSRISEPGEGV